MHKYEPCINERRIRVDGDVCPVVTCPEANKICFDMSRQSMFQQEVLLVPFADTTVLVWTPWETTNIDTTETSSSSQNPFLFSYMAGGAESAEKAWQWALPMSSVPLYVQQEEQHYKAHNDQAYCVKRNILILLCMSLFKKKHCQRHNGPEG